MFSVKVDRKTGFVKGIFDDKNAKMSALVGYHGEKSCIEKSKDALRFVTMTSDMLNLIKSILSSSKNVCFATVLILD